MTCEEIIEALLEIGVPAKLVVAVAQKFDRLEFDAERRERDRVRKRNQRSRPRTSAEVTGRPRTDPSLPPKERSPTPPKEITPPLTPPVLASLGQGPSAPFWPSSYREDFWQKYPHKVGKAAAFKSLERIWHSKARPSFAELLDALDRYINKTDDRHWCNPATWLNQERWSDQPAVFNGGGHAEPTYKSTVIDFDKPKRAVPP